MAVYVFSLLVGYRHSGVDTAQGIRDKYLQKTKQPIQYIFTETPDQRSMEVYTGMNIAAEHMVSAHMWMAGIKHLGGNYPLADMVQELTVRLDCDKRVREGNEIHLYKNEQKKATIFLKTGSEYVSRVMYYNSSKLLAEEYYSDRLLFTHYYETVKGENGLYARKYRTVYVNREGRRVFECLFDNNQEETYCYPNGQRYNTSEFLAEFIRSLELTQKDIVLIDRPCQLDFVQPLFTYGHQAKLIPFLHSGHYYEKGESPSAVYVNYEYYYWYKYSRWIDHFLVSTEAQKQELQDSLKEYGCVVPKIEVLQICGLDELRRPQKPRKAYAILTSSRLVSHKKIDWIIRGVIEAHESLPELTLDIYGGGPDEYCSMLKELVQSNHAEDYIRFMGHCQMDEVYQKYELYATASLHETFGLSVLEAIGSGNAVVGLDVRYGNRLLIEDGKNGKLVEFDSEDGNLSGWEEETPHKMAEAIVEMFQDREKLASYQEHSYEIASRYMNTEIGQKWVDFIDSISE